jgi:hypothetical protein
MMRLATLAVLLAACRAHEDAPPQDPQARKQQVIERALHHLDAPPAALPHHEYTRLLDAGAGPTRLLRYALAPGTTTAHISSQVRSRSFADHAWSAWTSAPPATDGFAVTVASDPRRLAIRMGARMLFATLDDRGQLGPVSFGDGQGETTDATQRLLALVVQLPAEPVGIGAKWRAVDVLRQRPAIVKQTVTYTLLARTETTLQLAVEIVRNGQPQTVTDAALPAGTAAELQTLHRTLNGTIEVDLARPIPTGTLALDARLHLRLAPASGAVQEQMFEDTGTVGVAP